MTENGRKQRWAVFISGRGSNLAALLSSPDYSQHPMALVVTSNPRCEGVSKARRAGVPVHWMRKGTWQELQDVLQKYRVDRLFLAGFLRILPQDFVVRWSSRALNVHPSLLPAYPGLKSIERAFEDRGDVGVTIHQVTAEVDGGEHLLRRRVFRGSDLPNSLESVNFFVHSQEHRLARRAIARWRPCA